jgi:hypothetical protein
MQLVELMAIGGGNNPVAAGTTLLTDSVSARTQPNYFQIALTGTAAQRPTATESGVQPLPAGCHYLDGSLSKLIVWDGATWRDPSSGTAV